MRSGRVWFVLVLLVLSITMSITMQAQSTVGGEAPIRVALVGLVHGHAKGFLRALPGNDSATLVAIVEPQEALAKEYAAKFGLNSKLFYTDLERMLTEQHPDAVLVYTAIADHRKVIEAAARHGVSSMVEKPLASTLEDAVAIRAIARKQHVQVLVNYETTWYASNREVFVKTGQGRYLTLAATEPI